MDIVKVKEEQMKKLQSFVKELNELQNKYDVDVSVSASDCSDWAGIYDLALVACMRKSPWYEIKICNL